MTAEDAAELLIRRADSYSRDALELEALCVDDRTVTTYRLVADELRRVATELRQEGL